MPEDPGGQFVVVLVDELGDYQREVVAGVVEVMAEQGVRVLVSVSHPLAGQPVELVTGLLEGAAVRGLVLTAMAGEERTEQALSQAAQRHAVPVVSVTRRIPGVVGVQCDNAVGMLELMSYLLDRRGAREVVYVAGRAGNPDAEEREAIVTLELGSRGLALAHRVQGDFQREPALHGMLALLDSGASLDCVVAANDEMAYGALEALRLRRRRIPGEVMVAGFDDLPASADVQWDLTSVDQQLCEQGRMAAQALLAQLGPELVPATVRVASRVVRRGTTGASSPDPGSARRSGPSGSSGTSGVAKASVVDVEHVLALIRALSAATTAQAVQDALVAHLPQLGVRACVLVDTPAGESWRVRAGFAGGEPLPAGEELPVGGLVPHRLLDRLGGRPLVQAVRLGGELPGYLAYELEEPADRTRASDVLHVDLTRALDAVRAVDPGGLPAYDRR